MRMKRLECTVACPKCFQVAGVVYAYQTSEREVWLNESEPPNIPKRCIPCNVPLARVPVEGKEIITIV